MTVVIVGGGHAGGQAAASLRQEGYVGEVIIVADEPHIPYQRPPLSKQYLAGEYGLERVYLRPGKFYEDRGIAVRKGVRALRINPDARTLECDNDETLAYDKLLLATGSRPRKLVTAGDDLAGVHYLRTIADVDAIRRDLKPGRRIAIVGGGYIGLEVAAVAVEMGLAVTVLEMEDRILGRVTTPEMSAFYHDLHTGKGVVIRTGLRAESFAGAEGRLTQVICAGGEVVAADLAVVGIGIVPNVELAAGAGLDCDNGVIVDETTRTTDPNIHAVGDCTNHPNPLLGRRLRLESVPNAMEQSRVAAANLAGGDKVYAAVPWFWSDQYDLKLQMVGFSAGADGQVTRGDPTTHQFATFHLSGDTVIAADAVNSAREFMAARQLVGKKVDVGSLGDPGVDLRAVLKAAS
ncbi:MAG: FAD-dependent oxidoreductase [Gammaproteobacteria bacterium]|nr:FAD-dependent oxidoreductase [Gammaproteobacteria bacterium]